MPPTAKNAVTRQGKGIVFLDLVKMIRVAERTTSLPGLSPAARELIATRIIATTWHDFDLFVEIVTTVHQKILGGSDQAGLMMGIQGGKRVFEGVHSAFVKAGEVGVTLVGFDRVWARYWNFGRSQVEVDGPKARITVSDYADCGHCHALIIVGWCLALIDLCGGRDARHSIIEEPSRGGANLIFELEWRE